MQHPAGALLIRPDGDVAWATDQAAFSDVDLLRSAIVRWFGVPRVNFPQ
ncbi:hydroxylase [Mycobacterium haemophilum DSM 44634]|nr:hypothetical protein [Mycobacterium haemophilum]MCV7342188.1 hypothetical protein [Mycobacterium haemophilum DSM 44634]